jgi:F0F1-type ATP synthase membrane subunit b/b'
MESLIVLKEILLRALPTFFLLWILYFYVSRFFVAPLQKTLKQRRDSTEGLRQSAEQRLSQAEQKTAAYQDAMRASSAEIYRQQEKDRQKAMERRAEILRQARERAEARIAQGRQEVRAEAEAAKKGLEAESEQMAQWITRAVMERPATSAAGRTS